MTESTNTGGNRPGDGVVAGLARDDVAQTMPEDGGKRIGAGAAAKVLAKAGPLIT